MNYSYYFRWLLGESVIIGFSKNIYYLYLSASICVPASSSLSSTIPASLNECAKSCYELEAAEESLAAAFSSLLRAS